MGDSPEFAVSAQTRGKSWVWPNCRWPSLSHGLGQVGESYPCKHCRVEWCQQQLGAQLAPAFRSFTQIGIHRAVAGSLRLTLGAQGSSRYVYWYINNPLNTWSLGDPPLPGTFLSDALEFPIWDLFPDLLSVWKKSCSWEMPQRDNLEIPTRAIRKLCENLKLWNMGKTHLLILWNKTATQHNFL